MQPIAPDVRRELAAIFAGGALGTLARAGLVEAFPPAPATWPWATLIANLVGAAVLGYAVVRLGGGLPRLRFVGTGFCGALTTFSALQVELLLMLDDGAYGLAAGYAAVSVAAGLACVVGGMRVARRAVPA